MGSFLGYSMLFLVVVVGIIYADRKKLPWKKELFFLMILLASCMIFTIIPFFLGEQGQIFQIERNLPGKGSKEIPLVLEFEIQGSLQKYPYVLSVKEQRITEDEKKRIFQNAIKELEETILEENQSFEKITGNLNLTSKLQKGLVKVSYDFEPSNLISSTGKILWENLQTENFEIEKEHIEQKNSQIEKQLQENLEQKNMVKVIAKLECQEEQVNHEFYLQLQEKELDAKKVLLEKLQEKIDQENQQGQNKYLSLPEEINGILLKWHDGEEPLHRKIFILGLAGMVLCHVYGKEKKQRQEKERNRQLLRDYPEIVNQLSLLSGAGMTISVAWGKIVASYKKKKEKEGYYRAGYEEMLKTWYEIQDGVGELQAYENFGNRCNQAQYRKLSSLFIQNTRKGAKGMREILDLEEKEAFAKRKMDARKMGEEAGTKLLLPMGILLILVFGILMIPAMSSLGV